MCKSTIDCFPQGLPPQRHSWSLRSWLAWLGRAALVGTIGLLALPPVVIAVYTPAAGPVQLPPPVEDQRRYGVYVLDSGIHTAIVIEQPQGWQLGPPGQEEATYVEYGWGDRAWYMEDKRGPLTVVSTVALPSESVTYVEGRATPHSGGRTMLWRQVPAEQLARLVQALETSMQRTKNGRRAEPFPAVAHRPGRFYPAREFYIFWYDCNAWTVRQLAEAELATGPAGVVLSSQVPQRLVGFQKKVEHTN